MNVLMCDQCETRVDEENELDWLSASDQYGYQGDFCSWQCLRDFCQEWVDNPPEGIEDVPELAEPETPDE